MSISYHWQLREILVQSTSHVAGSWSDPGWLTQVHKKHSLCIQTAVNWLSCDALILQAILPGCQCGAIHSQAPKKRFGCSLHAGAWEKHCSGWPHSSSQFKVSGKLF